MSSEIRRQARFFEHGGGQLSPDSWTFDIELDLQNPMGIAYQARRKTILAHDGSVNPAASWTAKGARIRKGQAHVDLVRR